MLGISMLDLARFQFAQTTVFHFFFVAFSIGMGLMVAVMETIYVIKKQEKYKKMTQFWAKIFLLSFAVGVVTGIIQEFQFGMNWSDYSRYVGDIFGAPLAVEALVAFFAESTFLGLWMFTWDRFKPGLHAVLIWIAALASVLSALWILAANSFMQNPVGYSVNAGRGRLELKDFFQLIINSSLWREFPHVITGAVVTAGIAVLGMSAYKLLKKQDLNIFKPSFKVAAAFAFIGATGSLVTGDIQTFDAQTAAPMKFAAMEGIYDNDGTPANGDYSKAGAGTTSQNWTVFQLSDPTDPSKIYFKIQIPVVLSILGHHNVTGYNPGQKTINEELKAKYGSSHPEITNFFVDNNVLFFSFRVMAGFAGLFFLVSVISIWFARSKKDTIEKKRWLLWLLVIMIPTPFLANTAGWLITELGRFPWVVNGLLTIADAVSPNVSFTSLLITDVVYFATFSLLGIVMVYLSARILRQGEDSIEVETIGGSKSSKAVAGGEA